ncbi:hypothetical protein ACLKA6_010706 [Drosophila palustris]
MLCATDFLISKANLINLSLRKRCCSNECPKSAFGNVKVTIPAEVFHLTKLYLEDKNENKVNLGVGAYRTDENKPYVLPIVKKCEFEVVNDPKMNHEYLPMSGNPDFVKAATEFLLGADCKALAEKRVAAVQTVSGSSACRLAAEFLAQSLKRRTLYLPNPTWENHAKIFKQAGFKQIKEYPYWNSKRLTLDMPGLLSALTSATEGAVVILHGTAHNPTGLDPTKKQWKQIAEAMKLNKLFPFIDIAYQGFATGDPERDAWAVRYFCKEGFELMAAQSFSKNMGLYNERVGNLVTVLNDKELVAAVTSQLTLFIRTNYSNPPAFGSRVVAKVLSDKKNKEEWLTTIKEMTDRVKKMRKELSEILSKLKTPGRWDHIVKQRGMFSYSGLTEQQVEKLRKEYHIYMLKSGRINVCGLNTNNIDYVAESIDKVVRDAAQKNGESKSDTKDNSDKEDAIIKSVLK